MLKTKICKHQGTSTTTNNIIITAMYMDELGVTTFKTRATTLLFHFCFHTKNSRFICVVYKNILLTLLIPMKNDALTLRRRSRARGFRVKPFTSKDLQLHHPHHHRVHYESQEDPDHDDKLHKLHHNLLIP
jgi:hypothetical protein